MVRDISIFFIGAPAENSNAVGTGRLIDIKLDSNSMSAPVDPQALSMAEDRAKNIADSPGGKVLQLLIRRPNGDVDELTDQEVDALKQLACNYREFYPVYRYLTSPAERPLQGKELARACGLVLSKTAGHPFHILGLPQITIRNFQDEVSFRTEEEIVENFDQLNADITEKYELHIERIIWKQWVHRSGSSLDAKTKLNRILGKVSAAFLWDLKTKCMTENNFPECALQSLEHLLFGMPSSLSSLYSEEINSILRQLEVFLPDFTMDDFLFGDTYNLIDPHDTNAFMKLYIKALIILLNCDSYADESFQNFATVFQSRQGFFMENLLSANKDCDVAKFRSEWTSVYVRASAQHQPTELILRTSLFYHELRNRDFVESMVDLVHSNIGLYTGLPARRWRRLMLKAEKKYLGCYSAVCQSSGSGKTKNMIGMGEFALLFYICARHDNTIGFPYRSQIFDLIARFTSGTDFIFFFYAMFDVFLKWLDDPVKLDLVNLGVDENGAPQRIASQDFFKSFSLHLADSQSQLHKDFWKEVKATTVRYTGKFIDGDVTGQASDAAMVAQYTSVLYQEQQTLTLVDNTIKIINSGERALTDDGKKLLEANLFPDSVSASLTSKMTAIVEKCRSLPGGKRYRKNPAIPIIIVFDEARNLFKNNFSYADSLFRSLRHTIPCFVGNGYFLFADTSSQIANFAPTLVDDQSARVRTIGHELFPPIMHFPAMNILKASWLGSGIEYLHANAHDKDWAKLKYDHLDCVSRGRPVFVVACNSDLSLDPEKRFATTVSYALSRILPQKVDVTTVKNSSDKKQIMRAAAACLLDLSFNKFDINDSLMASFLAYGVSLSRDRRFFKARYYAEAVLQEAFAKIHQADKEGFVKQLALDVEYSLPMQCDKGLKGEVLAGYYLLLANFRLDDSKKQDYAKPSTVYEFFDVLFGSNAEILNSLPGETANGFVAFNAIRRMSCNIENGHLLNAWRRRVLLLCKTGAKAIDLVIPIVRGSENGGCIEANIDTISSIAVHVKNWSDPFPDTVPPPDDSTEKEIDVTSLDTPDFHELEPTPSTSVGTTSKKRKKDNLSSNDSKPSNKSEKGVHAIGLSIHKLVKHQHKIEPVSIVMAVGEGGFRDSPNVIQVDECNVLKLSARDLRRRVGIVNDELENHFLDLNDPLMDLPGAVATEFAALEDDSSRQHAISMVVNNWEISLDP